MNISNATIVQKAGMITTGTVTAGLLNPGQARTFLKQTFDSTPLSALVRRVMKRERKGEIDKIGIDARILRKKIEGMDAKGDGSPPTLDPATGRIVGYRASPKFGKIEYSTEQVRLPWEVSNDTLRENIEGENLAAVITNLMTTQLGQDLEDIFLHGDMNTPVTDPDYDFLKINDGWIKQIADGGHIYNASAYSGMKLDMFYGAVAAMPNKYNNDKLRWIMSPRRHQEWELNLLNKALEKGASVPESIYNNPASIPALKVPKMPDDIILLVDPQNLIVVNTYAVKILKADNDTESIMQDKRSYVIHLDFDNIVEELDATAIIKNIK